MDEHTYMLQCSGIERACRMMIRFMHDAGIYLPECVVFSRNGSARMVPAAEIASTEKLIVYVRSQNSPRTIVCTAATDRQDENRVVLAYAVDLNILTLSFPMEQGQLSGEEQALLSRMKTVL